MPSERHEIRCRVCGKPVVLSAQREAPDFPFCSQRCKLIDLGRWLTGAHRIETPLEREPGPETGASQGQ